MSRFDAAVAECLVCGYVRLTQLKCEVILPPAPCSCRVTLSSFGSKIEAVCFFLVFYALGQFYSRKKCELLRQMGANDVCWVKVQLSTWLCVVFPHFSDVLTPHSDTELVRLSLGSHSDLICFRQGTVFLMHVPLSGSTSSTMTNGASSNVTMDRWSSSLVAAPPYSS